MRPRFYGDLIVAAASERGRKIWSAIYILFSLLCCWTPMIAWQILRLQVVKVQPTFCDNFHAWATIFPWISPVSNALLYSFVRKQFQQSLTQFFHRGLKPKF